MEDPWTDLDVNCRGNLVLLEALRAANPGAKLVFVGSRLAVRARGRRMPVARGPRRPIRCASTPIHKLTVEQYLRLYGQLFGLRYAIARV